MDLKPSNFLVSADGSALVADLGSAKKLDENSTDEILITYTDHYGHPLLKRHANTKTDSNRVRGYVKRSVLATTFDLYALGKSLFQIVSSFDEHSPHVLDPYTRKYLQLMAARLLDGHNEKQEDLALGLPERVFKEVRYETIEQVFTDFHKLIGTFELEREIPELARSAPSYVQVSTLARTPFTDRLARLMNEPLVRRQAAVSQLGLLNLLYPTATHTRLEHALGTYTNAAQYIYYLYHDPINPFFRQVMTVEDLVTVLVAAFLHDLGQYPLAHDLEDAHPVVFRHSALTKVLLKAERVEIKTMAEKFQEHLDTYWGVTASRVNDILDANPNKQDVPLKDRLLHTLIDGPIDADKLDYLVRDSHECGVPYGQVIDFPRLLRTLTVIYSRKEKGKDKEFFIGLGIHEKGRVAAECVAFARYAMFAQVYWHHTARAVKAMLHRAVWEWLESDKKSNNDQRKNDFHKFLMELGRPEDMSQASLFDSHTVTQKPNSPYGDRGWSQVHPGDLAVLQWIRDRTSTEGALLVEELLRRQMYKRLGVVTEQGNSKLWEQLQQIRRGPNYVWILELARELQKLLVQQTDNAVNQGRTLTSTAADTDAVTTAISVLKSRAAILVDVPLARAAEEEGLRYLPESQHREHRDLFENAPAMEDSRVWELLGGHVFGIAGKVRVFGHPSIAVLSRTLLTPGLVESKLGDAAYSILNRM
jgi:HD superfamily phosphohydrolase